MQTVILRHRRNLLPCCRELSTKAETDNSSLPAQLPEALLATAVPLAFDSLNREHVFLGDFLTVTVHSLLRKLVQMFIDIEVSVWLFAIQLGES